MRAEHIHPDHEYAYRKSPTSRVPFERVLVLERVSTSRGKWKIRFLDDPYPGLEEYTRSACIVAPWSHVKRIERYEARLGRVQAVSLAQWPGSDHPLEEAVNEVLQCTGEDLSVWRKGLLEGPTDAAHRVAARANTSLTEYGVAFENEGMLVAPFGTALQLAIAFAAAEPSTVLAHINLQRRRYEIEVKEPGKAYLEPAINRWRAAWALASQWAGHDAALATKEAEIERLREIIRGHIVDLRYRHPEEGHPGGLALKLERALRGQ